MTNKGQDVTIGESGRQPAHMISISLVTSTAAKYFSYILQHTLETRGQHSNTNMGGDGEGLEEK